MHMNRINFMFMVIVTWMCLLFAGVNLTLSTMIDGKNFNAGGHKMGIGLEFEA